MQEDIAYVDENATQETKNAVIEKAVEAN